MSLLFVMGAMVGNLTVLWHIWQMIPRLSTLKYIVCTHPRREHHILLAEEKCIFARSQIMDRIPRVLHPRTLCKMHPGLRKLFREIARGALSRKSFGLNFQLPLRAREGSFEVQPGTCALRITEDIRAPILERLKITLQAVRKSACQKKARINEVRSEWSKGAIVVSGDLSHASMRFGMLALSSSYFYFF